MASSRRLPLLALAVCTLASLRFAVDLAVAPMTQALVAPRAVVGGVPARGRCIGQLFSQSQPSSQRSNGANLFTESTNILDEKIADCQGSLIRYPCAVCAKERGNSEFDNFRTPSELTFAKRASLESGCPNSKAENIRLRERLLRGTWRELLQYNVKPGTGKDDMIVVGLACKRCGSNSHIIQTDDTPQSLHLDLRRIYTNDQRLPRFFNEIKAQPDIPDDANYVCELSSKLPDSVVARLDGKTILRSEVVSKIVASLQYGELWRRLREKMKQSSTRAYLRVGIGLQAWGQMTGVLEIWPSGHTSPKHQHGGCAGCVRVLHGELTIKIYGSIDEDDVVGEPIKAEAGKITWMNRANGFCHEVSCDERDALNNHGFAASVHIYKSCDDEFEFTTENGAIVKSNPENDFFWNVDLPATDQRLNEHVRSFNEFVLEASREPPKLEIGMKIEEIKSPEGAQPDIHTPVEKFGRVSDMYRDDKGRLRFEFTRKHSGEKRGVLNDGWWKYFRIVSQAPKLIQGDVLQALPGEEYQPDGRDVYKPGDFGNITRVGKKGLWIRWERSGAPDYQPHGSLKWPKYFELVQRVNRKAATPTTAPIGTRDLLAPSWPWALAFALHVLSFIIWNIKYG